MKKLLLLMLLPLNLFHVEGKDLLTKLDDSGNAIAVWSCYEPGTNTSVIKASTLTSGSGAWSANVILSDDTVNSEYPFIAQSSTGDVVCLWTTEDRANGIIAIYGSYLPIGGSWSSPVRISLTSENVSKIENLVMNTDEYIIVTWTTFIGGYPLPIPRSSTADFGGAWSTPLTISGGQKNEGKK